MPKASADHSTAAAASPRRGMLAGFLALPAVVAPLALGDAAGADPDAALVAIAADLAEATTAYSVAAHSEDEEAGDKASEAIGELLRRMIETPAQGLAGLAAKMGPLCFSLSEGQGRDLAFSEYPLLDSLADDLVRVVPQAVPALPAPPPEPVREFSVSDVLPELPWQAKAREESERLAAVGLDRDRGFTAGDVQLVGWLLRRIEADMGRAVAERVRDLSIISADSFDTTWHTFLDHHNAGARA